jgi:lipopolysaccharide/colanic/teichoic acid biosynthesis glycosyltransferase
VIAVVGLILFAPLFGPIALAIKMESPGSPLFFFWDRLGRRGHFRLVGFRTMRVVRTHTGSEWIFTPVGRVLRRFQLDGLW